MDAQNITGIALISLSYILGIIATYYGYKFYKWKDQIIFIKRRGNIVTWYTICGVILLLIGYPFIFFIEYEPQILPHESSTGHKLVTTVNDLCFNPFYYFAIFFALTRYWLIYYDIQYANSCSNLDWKQCINADIELLQRETWYIKHRSDYGNHKYIMKRSMYLALFISIISLTSVYLYEFDCIDFRFWRALNGFVSTIIIISLLYFWQQMPSFNDSIYLKKEAKTITICWSAATITFIVCYIITSDPRQILK